MKIIFLDFDGVLNSFDTLRRADSYYAHPNWHDTHIDPIMVSRLNDLLERSGAHVVISSSWRNIYDLEELKSILSRRGLEEKFLDRFVDVTPTLDTHRGEEIQAWFEGHPASGFSLVERGEVVENFVIIDDDNDMLHLKSYLVQTSLDTGMTEHHVEAALAILAGP
jgi:Swiss Army Knife RNA repair-like protein